MRYRKSL